MSFIGGGGAEGATQAEVRGRVGVCARESV